MHILAEAWANPSTRWTCLHVNGFWAGFPSFNLSLVDCQYLSSLHGEVNVPLWAAWCSLGLPFVCQAETKNLLHSTASASSVEPLKISCFSRGNTAHWALCPVLLRGIYYAGLDRAVCSSVVLCEFPILQLLDLWLSSSQHFRMPLVGSMYRLLVAGPCCTLLAIIQTFFFNLSKDCKCSLKLAGEWLIEIVKLLVTLLNFLAANDIFSHQHYSFFVLSYFSK